MSRKKLVVANWKMNNGIADSLKFLTSFLRHHNESPQVDVVICPPFVSLYTAGIALQDSDVLLGAQNSHFEDSGAFTGEVAPVFLSEIGCRYVIVGHSERRHIFGESDDMIAKKVLSVLANGMHPIFCVGETESEREQQKTFQVLERQIRAVFPKIEKSDLSRVVVAYEPVWAIGTGKTATPGQAEEAHGYIRELIGKIVGTAFAGEIKILYGGSVKPDNVPGLMKQPNIDGALVGGASLDPDNFLAIVKQTGLAY